MAITVSGRKMNVTPAIKDYVDEKIGRALEVFDSAAMDAEVVLRTEKNPAISLNAICEVTVNAKGARHSRGRVRGGHVRGHRPGKRQGCPPAAQVQDEDRGASWRQG